VASRPRRARSGAFCLAHIPAAVREPLRYCPLTGRIAMLGLLVDIRCAYLPMTSSTRVLAPLAAIWLLAAGGVTLAASPPVTDELLAPLTSAYARAVK